jgi:hypothetical protein
MKIRYYLFFIGHHLQKTLLWPSHCPSYRRHVVYVFQNGGNGGARLPLFRGGAPIYFPPPGKVQVVNNI